MKEQLEFFKKAIENKRDFDLKDLWYHMRKLTKVWSWGVEKIHFYENKLLGLKVNGHHFTGIVCITLNGNDTFNIDYWQEGVLLDTKNEIYIDQLIDVIDLDIEFIKSYSF